MYETPIPFSKLLPHRVIEHTNNSRRELRMGTCFLLIVIRYYECMVVSVHVQYKYNLQRKQSSSKLKSFGIFSYGENTGYSRPVSVKWRWWGVPLDHWAQFMSPRRFRPFGLASCLVLYPWPLLTCGQLFSQLGYARSPEPYPGSSSPPQDRLAWSAWIMSRFKASTNHDWLS